MVKITTLVSIVEGCPVPICLTYSALVDTLPLLVLLLLLVHRRARVSS